MPDTVAVLNGKCLCGAVEYAVDDAFEYAMNCDCSNCRRTTGSAFKPIAGIGRERLQLVKSEEATLIYGNPDETHDVHCGTCGSLVYSVVSDGAYAHLPTGTLMDAPTIRPTAHIFLGRRRCGTRLPMICRNIREFPETKVFGRIISPFWFTRQVPMAMSGEANQ